jgi:hypothetical protein
MMVEGKALLDPLKRLLRGGLRLASHSAFTGMFVGGVLATLVVPHIAVAGMSSHAHNTGQFRLVQDPHGDSYWTTDGDITLAAQSYAYQKPPDQQVWDPANGSFLKWTGLKSQLPGTKPALPGNEVGGYSIAGCVQTYAAVGMTYARSNARAAWTPGYIWGTLDWDTWAGARGNPAAQECNSYGNSYIKDPTQVGWDGAGTYELILEVTLDSGSGVGTVPYGSAGFESSSWLDLDDDGVFDQLFWSLEYGRDAVSGPYVDFALGPNVYLTDGMTEEEIESTISSMWSDDYNLLLTDDVVFAAGYTINATEAGTLSFDFDASAGASQAIPEPGMLMLVSVAGVALALIRRHEAGC